MYICILEFYSKQFFNLPWPLIVPIVVLKNFVNQTCILFEKISGRMKKYSSKQTMQTKLNWVSFIILCPICVKYRKLANNFNC